MGIYINSNCNTSVIKMQKAQELLGKVTGGAVGHKLPTAKLGKNGPQVTRMGYGAMGLSAFYGAPKPDEDRFKVLDKLYESGEFFWDSADMYMDNEDLLGKWFQANPGKRDHIFLATKLAWILAQGEDFFPIPGTTNLERLDENLGALHLKLSKDEEQEIRKACEAAEVHGGRYPEAFASACFADTPPLNA